MKNSRLTLCRRKHINPSFLGFAYRYVESGSVGTSQEGNRPAISVQWAALIPVSHSTLPFPPVSLAVLTTSLG